MTGQEFLFYKSLTILLALLYPFFLYFFCKGKLLPAVAAYSLVLILSVYWLNAIEEIYFTLGATFIWVVSASALIFGFIRINRYINNRLLHFMSVRAEVSLLNLVMNEVLMFPWVDLNNLLVVFPFFRPAIGLFSVYFHYVITGLLLLLFYMRLRLAIPLAIGYGVFLFMLKVQPVTQKNIKVIMGPSDLENTDEKLGYAEKLIHSDTNSGGTYIFPETFIFNPLIHQLGTENHSLKQLEKMLHGNDLVIGANYIAPKKDKDTLKYNVSLQLLEGGDELEIVNKSKYIPISEKDVPVIGERPGNYAPVDLPLFKNQFYLRKSGVTALPLTCYDSSFKWESDADIVILLCEERFFKSTFGQYLYFHHTLARALELGKTVIRCSNGGLTGYVTADGAFHSIDSFRAWYVPVTSSAMDVF